MTENRSKILPEPEAISLLDTYGIKYPEHNVATSPSEAVMIAERIGYPVVMKVVSPQIIHKSDAGGVCVNISDSLGAVLAYNKITDSVAKYDSTAKIDGIIVCKQAQAGLELVVGATRDPVFGPTVMFGLGGIFVEVLQDVSFRVCPLTRKDSIEMIKETKGYQILRGTRGKAASDIMALVDLLHRVSHLMMDRPDIEELDLNPVRVYEKGLDVLDARIIVRAS